jgi:hypothetical protein
MPGTSYWYQGVSVTVRGRPSLIDCRWGTEVVGAVRLFIEPKAAQPTPQMPDIYEASARVAYRQETVVVPLSFTADRRTAIVTVEDELLRGADLRCLAADSSGQAVYDPRQPNGGPVSEDEIGAYFSGFSPRSRLRRALRRCNTKFHPGPRRAACRRRARERFANATAAR